LARAARSIAVAPARPSRRARRDALVGFAFISPWVLGFLLFTLGPMLASFYLSFTRYNIVQAPRWIGLENFEAAITGADRLFYSSIGRTAYFAALIVPLGVTASLGLAVMLNRRLRGTTIFRTLFFLPSLTPVAASAVLWVWLFHPDVGPVNYVLGLVHIAGPRWLASQEWAIPTMVLIALWGSAGGSRMIIFLAGLQGVPEELYDAASIDGANNWQRFRHVTLPLLSPVVLFNVVLAFLGAFQTFALAVMATDGGPAYATWFYMLHLYNTAFRSLQMGYGAALAWIFLLLVVTFTYVQFRASVRWVYYAGDQRD
jgi:multiple sugar transport system permease protein